MKIFHSGLVLAAGIIAVGGLVSTPAAADHGEVVAPADVEFTKAYFHSDAQKCGKGTFYDPRKGGECWSCPSDFKRTLAPVTADDACRQAPRESVARATQTRRPGCPAGSFYDPRKGGECWSCPSDHNRTLAPVTAKNACAKPVRESTARATSAGKSGCAKGSFYDPRKGGECWSCPSGFKRSLAPVTAKNACARSVKVTATRAKLHRKKGCPAGSFYDPRKGGECWSCPSGFKRGVAPVTSREACLRAPKETVAKAKLQRSAGCQKGAFFDPRKGGECWTCPSGHKRTLAPVTAKNACSKPAKESVSKAKYHRKTGCPKGSFFDPRKGGECWSCPSGYKRSLAAVTAKNACAKGVFGKTAKAKYKGKSGCSSGTFFDPRKGGECWSCPSGYRRSLAAVTAGNACAKPGKKVDTAAKFVEKGGCPKGSFFDPRAGGQCWSCPSGFKRSLAPVTAKNACAKPGKLAATKASFKAKDNCPKGTFFDPRKGGECWSCPSGYRRSLTAVTSPKACTTALTEEIAKATLKGAGGCPKGTFFDPRKGGECWSCPAGYKRSLAPVTANNACARPGKTVVAKASRIGPGGCEKGSFFDPRNNGECWSCPASYKRSLAPVTANNACAKPGQAALAQANFRHKTPCPDGTFHYKPFGKPGQCLACPKGFFRVRGSETTNEACSRRSLLSN